MTKGRPTRMKSSIAKLRGVARERAVLAASLVDERDYGAEAADLVASAAYVLEDDIVTSAAFAKEIGSVAMDYSALVETSSPGVAVNGAAMAFHAYRSIAEAHDQKDYLRRFDEVIVGLPALERRFGE